METRFVGINQAVINKSSAVVSDLLWREVKQIRALDENTADKLFSQNIANMIECIGLGMGVASDPRRLIWLSMTEIRLVDIVGVVSTGLWIDAAPFWCGRAWKADALHIWIVIEDKLHATFRELTINFSIFAFELIFRFIAVCWEF